MIFGVELLPVELVKEVHLLLVGFLEAFAFVDAVVVAFDGLSEAEG